MKDSIIQGLTAAVAGILFCVAVTMLLHEVGAITEMEKVVGRNARIVTERDVSDHDGW